MLYREGAATCGGGRQSHCDESSSKSSRGAQKERQGRGVELAHVLPKICPENLEGRSSRTVVGSEIGNDHHLENEAAGDGLLTELSRELALDERSSPTAVDGESDGGIGAAGRSSQQLSSRRA